MIKVENFNQLIDRAIQTKGHAHMRPVIAKELLHYDILFSLENNALLDQLTFQGGTSLRLCYGSDRFSEDLDFVGGYDFSTADLIGIKDCLETYIGKKYGLEIEVKEPKEIAQESQYNEISRFLPIDVQERTLQKNKFVDFLINENKAMLAQTKEIVDKRSGL